jgi:PTS system fructose-specific IIC component
LLTAFVMYTVVGTGLQHLTGWLHVKLAQLQFENLVVLGLVLGLLSCCDLGGAISKTAFGYGTVMLEGSDPSKFGPLNMTIMATVVAAVMVPPIAMSVATLVRGELFSDSERSFGKVSWLFGAVALSEGTIPFALSDPLRVLPASMAGGAVTGALVTTFSATISYPFGGIFAADLIGKPLLFAVAVAAGVFTTTLSVLGLKSLRRAERVAETGRAVGSRRRTVAAGRA